MDNEPSIAIPVSDVVYSKTKAIIATLTTSITVLAAFGFMISDGSFSWEDGGALIGAVTGAVTTVLAVWRVPNEIKTSQ